MESVMIDMTFSSPITPSTVGDNPSHSSATPTKRKGDEDVVELLNSSPAGPSSSSSRQQEKRVKTNGSGLVEIKNGKLKFTQTSYNRSIPRRRMHRLEGLLIDAAEENKVVSDIPQDLWDVIVMAGHELSSSNEALFVKHLKTELVKGMDLKMQETLSIDALTPLVPKLFTMHQYGLLPTDFGNSPNSKFPAALQIRCWEANSDDFFPMEKRAEIVARREERVRAREMCVELIKGMNEGERGRLVKPDKSGKIEVKAEDKEKDSAKEMEKEKEKEKEKFKVLPSQEVQKDAPLKEDTPLARRTREGTGTTADSSRRSMSPTKKSKLSPEELEARRIKQEEKEAAMKEKLEKKAAKEREEQKKAEEKRKQAQAFGSFFKAKPKAPEPSSISLESLSGPLTAPAEVSDFSKTFKSFLPRANVTVAPLDPFVSVRSTRKEKISGQDIEKWNKHGAPEVSQWTARDFIRDHIQRTLPQSAKLASSSTVRGLKSAPRYGSVGEVWAAHQEAVDPRAVLRQLRDNGKFPWKTLAFDQQARPPYSGTFTKRSLVVGPRTPFAQDPIFDYSYDSGDDWAEEEEGGEDVDDFERCQDEDEDAEEEDEEGEFDDWLDDSDDVAYDVDADGDDPMIASGPSTIHSSPNRLPYKPVRKPNHNHQHLATHAAGTSSSFSGPKKLTKLTPYWRGPVWETQIGEPTEGLEQYSIQLLNDAPIFLDPFTYVGPEPASTFKTTFSETVIGTNLAVKCLLAAEHVVIKQPVATASISSTTMTTSFAPHKLHSSGSENGTMPLGDASATANKETNLTHHSPNSSSSTRAPPKIGFPSSHLPELLRAIEGNTKIRTDLVSALRERFDKVATKAAIEAKISEVATREGKSKDSQWRVKEEAWVAAGCVPPTLVTTTPLAVG